MTEKEPKINREAFGETMGDMFKLFNKLETEEDFKEFYKIYWELTEEAIIKKREITFGEKRPIAETYHVVRDNLCYLLGDVNKMRADYARKVWWFLL